MSETPPKSDQPSYPKQPADVEQLWKNNPEWGPKSDYNLIDLTELDGYTVGETVRLVEDGPEGGYVGDEGIIVGISHVEAGTFNPEPRTELLVWFDEAGYAEPTGGITPEMVEPE